MTTVHIADTGFVVTIGSPSNERYRRVRTFFNGADRPVVVPQRVYEELTASEIPDSSKPLPVDTAIDEGWLRIAQPLDYSMPVVSRTMDGVQRYIASADGRPEDEVERADAALGGLAAQVLGSGAATQVYVYTTDIAAGEGIETVLESEGYGDSVAFVDGFRFVEDLLDR
ncbi:hypothetical protein C488_04307 [Natrinema pellirubrum DSM 15624]|uniref:Nucleic acid-binding protein, contains PIN domain n=1 Tax=Natrinema pellirubrum (strain DSM 15624 / CIP 106293 / JCM 10476 / NCIMB 786 / 157) TaxID=797303 RepID=L0JHW0_NATP1|nr:hypothetical protein [Natrinema pellirubrum]AGB30428.1 hypothetical protein Natpe_0498 [Natrinema pellirubrum DSM 15624]ELY79345.1 hypothetical protein C488_04307 [Natrinema pellirubrum DSM 15624]